MQSLLCEKQHNTMRHVFTTMVREEGALRPLRGLNAMALGAGPAHAMYFTALEQIRENLTIRASVPVHLASGLSAVIATLLHDAIMTPADGEGQAQHQLRCRKDSRDLFYLVVKQRMQMCCSPFTSCTQATFSIYNSEGLRAFYRSYLTQLTMNVPFQVH